MPTMTMSPSPLRARPMRAMAPSTCLTTALVTIPADRPFYIMNPEGRFEIIAAEGQNSVEAMEGLFVVASGTGETVTFSTSAPESKGSRVSINLSDGQHVVDRAIIRFDECSQLPKFQLKANSTKVYIPQDDQDYALCTARAWARCPSTSRLRKTVATR